MLRTAFLCHSALAGSERVVPRLLGALDRREVDPIAVLPGDGPLVPEIERLGVPVHFLPLGWWIPATNWSAEHFLAQLEGLEARAEAVKALLRSERVELVDTEFIVTLEGALAAAELRLPHVWHSRGLFGDGFPPDYFSDLLFLFSVVDRLADALVCVSAQVATQATAFCHRTAVRVVHDGLDLEGFLASPAPSRDEARDRLEVTGRGPVLLCVGGLQRRKGQLDLIEALAAVAPAHPDLTLLLAGGFNDADYVAELHERQRALGLGGTLRFLGFQSDVRGLLAAADLLVHPSHSEGFGLAIVEAMAVGLPVVATRCGGPEEIVEDGISGVLVAPGDPPALATALQRLLADPGLCSRLGAAAAHRAHSFGLDRTAAQTVDLHAACAGRPAPPRDAAGISREVLRRAREAAARGHRESGSAPPHTPRRGSWLARLRRRSGGSTP